MAAASAVVSSPAAEPTGLNLKASIERFDKQKFQTATRDAQVAGFYTLRGDELKPKPLVNQEVTYINGVAHGADGKPLLGALPEGQHYGNTELTKNQVFGRDGGGTVHAVTGQVLQHKNSLLGEYIMPPKPIPKSFKDKFGKNKTMSRIDFLPSDMKCSMHLLYELFNDWMLYNQDVTIFEVNTLEFDWPELPMWSAYLPGAVGTTQFKVRGLRVWFCTIGVPRFEEKYSGVAHAIGRDNTQTRPTYTVDIGGHTPQLFSNRPLAKPAPSISPGSSHTSYSEHYDMLLFCIQLLLVVLFAIILLK